jgi:hypothetical protein
MSVKLIDLQLIYGVAGAREKFEDLASQLVEGEQPDVDKVRIVQGDGGIDVYSGDIADPTGIDIFQCKFFPQGLDDSQKEQIRKSYRTCRDSTQFKARRWTLCLPVDLSIEEKKWFEEWRSKQASSSIVLEDPWGALKLEGLLYQEKNRGLKEAFFKEEHLAQIRDIHSLLQRLVPDIAARLKIDLFTGQKELDAQARQEEYLNEFRQSLRDGFRALVKPPPVSLSEIYHLRQVGDDKKANEVWDAGKQPGRWEVAIYPARLPEHSQLSTLKDCREVVEACQVNAGGREFPKSSHSGHESGSDWFGVRVAHTNIPESWRISQRRIFMHMSVIMDDLLPPPVFGPQWGKLMPHGFRPKHFLDLDVAIQFVTRVFRFAARLAERAFDPADEMVNVAIALSKTKDRVLVTRDDPERLMGWYIASSPSLEHTWCIKREELKAEADRFAVQAMHWIFERFNWPRVTEELLAKNQARLFSR